MDHAAGGAIVRASSRIYLAVQGDGFAGLVAADGLALQVQLGQARRVQKTQARVGGRDQETIIEPHTDVARRGVHIATLKQAAANAAHLFAGLGFSHKKAPMVIDAL
jgi:hypothetical protein